MAELPVREVRAAGSSNWVFRVGDDWAIRLPRSDEYVADLANEVRWLPRLAPHLPVAVPEVVTVGEPGPAFPRPWAVVSWVPGDLPLALDATQQAAMAESLGTFVQSLHASCPSWCARMFSTERSVCTQQGASVAAGTSRTRRHASRTLSGSNRSRSCAAAWSAQRSIVSVTGSPQR
nr:phosphotransferase [Nocardioides thalensis]